MKDFAVIKEIINSGNEICIPVNGHSMSPYLNNKKDCVYAAKPSFPLKIGNIAFFEDSFGRTVMHRVCKITSDGYFFRGDALRGVEGPVKASHVFAEVTRVRHNGKIYSTDSFYSRFHAVRAVLSRRSCL